jgi:biopolymer transport protein ExbD
MAEIVTKAKSKKGSHEDLESPRKPKRPGIRMDMTPMVDVAFLLLIFFMVTTVFRRPLAMEINMPEPGASVMVPESNVMTMYVLASDQVLTKTGKGSLEPIAWSVIETSLEDAQRANSDLIVLVKVDPEARYERMVEMMDILDNAKMQRFSLVTMTDRDRANLGGWQ